MAAAKKPLLKKAADRLLYDSKFQSLRAEMDGFRQENPWVEDSALFFCLIKFQVGFQRDRGLGTSRAGLFASLPLPCTCPDQALNRFVTGEGR